MVGRRRPLAELLFFASFRKQTTWWFCLRAIIKSTIDREEDESFSSKNTIMHGLYGHRYKGQKWLDRTFLNVGWLHNLPLRVRPSDYACHNSKVTRRKEWPPRWVILDRHPRCSSGFQMLLKGTRSERAQKDFLWISYFPRAKISRKTRIFRV